MTVGYLDTTKHALWPVITVEQLPDIAHRDDSAEVICNKCGLREPLDTQMLFPSETPPDMKVVDALCDHSCASCGAGVWDIAIRTSTAVVFCRTWVPEEVEWDVVVD